MCHKNNQVFFLKTHKVLGYRLNFIDLNFQTKFEKAEKRSLNLAKENQLIAVYNTLSIHIGCLLKNHVAGSSIF